MKNITIIISKAKILEMVSLNTAYANMKGSGDPDYERISTTASDNEILTRFWTETSGNISEKLKEYIVASANDNDTLRLQLELSGSYDETLTPSVENDLAATMAAGITALWFQFRFHERYEEWNIKCSSLLDRALSKLCHRIKPRRSHSDL